MALSDNISAITRILSLNVRVAGVRLRPVDATDPGGVPGVLRLRISKSLDAPVPVATITVNRLPTWIKRGQDVTIDLGFDGLRMRVFTGHVQDRAPGHEESDINCTGRLFAAFRTVEIPARSVDGLTVQAALENVLDYVGLTTGRSITSGGFTLGSASDAKLSRSTSAQMLQTIMDVEGYKIYEDGAGTVIIRAVDGPAPTPFKSLSTDTTATARIIGGRSREDPGFTRTRVTVVGATIIEGSEPDETSRTISQSATLVGETPVQPPLPSGTTVDTEFSNHLIDTNAKALEVARRLGVFYGRVPRQTLLEIPGDPQAEIGQTWQLDFPKLNLAGRFYIHGVQHNLGEQAYTTVLDLRGGDEFGGTVALEPHASFFYAIDRQVLDDSDRVWAFITFDATGSYDPDGSIASYAWSDDETTTPEINTLTTAVIHVRIDPTTITGDWTVTLTVTDNDGLTDAISFVVDVSVGAALVQIPSVFAAIDNNMSASPDGAQNWNDDADTDVVSVAAAPPDGVNTGRAVYGLADGSIMLTTDFLATDATEVKAANASKIWDIAWDWRDSRRVWAVDDDARVWLSEDSGATWAQYDDLQSVLSLGSATLRHIGLPGTGGVWVYGGTGANNPLIAYDATVHGHAWVNLAFGGELDSDLPASSAAFRIVDAQDTGAGAGLVIICENADAGNSGVRPIYHTSSPFTSADWERGTGFAAGDVDGRYVVGARGFTAHFIAAFADRDVWHSDDGVVWTETATVLPLNTVPHHCIWLEEEIHGLFTAGVYILACENTSDQSKGIFKSADELATVGTLRPVTGFDAWPASAIGRQVAVGPQNPTAGDDALLIVQSPGGTSQQTYERDTISLAGGVWAVQEDLGSVLQDIVTKVRKMGDNHYRLIVQAGTTAVIQGSTVGQLQRSTDGGANWANVGPSPKVVGGFDWGVSDYDIAADGTLWLCATSLTTNTQVDLEPEIYSSSDDGATWDFVYQESTQTTGSWEMMWQIRAQPTDSRIIVVLGDTNAFATRTWNTQDGAAPFTRETGSGPGNSTRSYSLRIWSSGRILGTETEEAYVSDDFGENWTQKDAGLSDNGSSMFAMERGLAGGHAYASVGSATEPEITRTLDFGETWDIILDENDFSASINALTGLYYDPATDILYISSSETGATPAIRVFALDNASAVLASDVGSQLVRNITYNLDSLMNKSIAPRGLAPA